MYDSDYECMAKKQEKNKTVQNHVREPKRLQINLRT